MHQIDLPDHLKPYQEEIIFWCGQLPILLANGYEGRHALIQGNRVVSLWDTRRDAVQAGDELFGQQRFSVQSIRQRDLDGFKSIFPSLFCGEELGIDKITADEEAACPP